MGVKHMKENWSTKVVVWSDFRLGKQLKYEYIRMDAPRTD